MKPPPKINLAFIWEEDFGPLSNGPVLSLLSPGKTLLTLLGVQEWLDNRNSTLVAHFPDTSVRGDSVCTGSSLSPLLVNLPLDHPLKSAVIPLACAPFPTTISPSSQLSINMLCFDTALCEQPGSPFSNVLLRFTLLVEGVSDCLLDNCHVSSLPHDCGCVYWTRLRS